MEKKQFKGTLCKNGELKWIRSGMGFQVLTADSYYSVCEAVGKKNQEEQVANTQLIAAAPELLEALQRITNMSNESGRKGCTYGDTDYDSESVVFGYNLCLEYITGDIQKIINKALGI